MPGEKMKRRRKINGTARSNGGDAAEE